jgi:hypothetical protein
MAVFGGGCHPNVVVCVPDNPSIFHAWPRSDRRGRGLVVCRRIPKRGTAKGISGRLRPFLDSGASHVRSQGGAGSFCSAY